jgi:DNA primase
MNAETIARALRGRKVGGEWITLCPAHDDHTPSLSLRDAEDGKVLVHCHSGCDQGAVISTLKCAGLWTESVPHAFGKKLSHQFTQNATSDRDNARRTEGALSIYKTAQQAKGTLVETYLGERGLRLPVTGVLRFHEALRHPTGDYWPTMIGLVTRGSDGSAVAIHRTFLARDGATKAPLKPEKMMLGPCRGGAVRLAEHSSFLMVGEGIETCLSAMQATGNPAWAALSTSGLRTLELPREVRDVIVLADGDDAGEAAARDCAMKWKKERRRVRIARPPKGMDCNDLLLARMSAKEEAM